MQDGSRVPGAHRVPVPRDAAGERVDRFLARSLGMSLSRARDLASEGRVRVRGKTCSPLRRLSGGEELEVRLPSPRRGPRSSHEPALPALYDDGDVLVVAKPAGLPVEPSVPGATSAVGAASRMGRFDVGGQALPGLAHRLDRGTSGCLLFARSDLALAALRRAFAASQVEKEYLAVVAGDPPGEMALDTPYGREPRDPRRFTTRVASARRARLSFRVERRFAGAALLRVRLGTGRTHQIRVQLAEQGFPVLGDDVYGVASPHIGRQALHAVRLAFPRPSDGQRVVAVAPVPADLEELLRTLER
ncbi:MAG TPA: RluA family pseudouridine synthase [Anaeromyxobacteraceae bacterium]|nr:RluA family pseudouridine synthase [Anaeromyxobacteraceae bacterium]